MSHQRQSFISIDEWLTGCNDEEPDSIIYDPNYSEQTAQERTEENSKKIRSMLEYVVDIYTKVGMSTNKIDEHLDVIDGQVTFFMEEIKQSVQLEFDKLCKYKDSLVAQIQKILKDLHLPEFEPNIDITMLQACKRLKLKFDELNAVKTQRLKQLEELKTKQIKLCRTLDIEPPTLKLETDIPAEQELIHLHDAVQDLMKEEIRRQELYNLLKSMIVKCVDHLEYEPQNEAEKSMIDGPPMLGDNSLKKMSTLHAKLEALYDSQQKRFKEATERLISLYERLEVPEEDRDKFLNSRVICKPHILLELDAEIERYEILKKQNISKFIEKIKEEIEIEYDRCFLKPNSDILSLSMPPGGDGEHLLEVYEQEVERIKKYYEDNKDILERFHKWSGMYRELIELELKPYDPGRYNNRGGQLLLEEKKRKTLQKGMPKIEKELNELNEKFSQSNNGNKFQVLGQDLEEFIAGCWDALNHDKEEQKRERQRAKTTTSNSVTSSAHRVPIRSHMVMPRKSPAKRFVTSSVTPTPTKMLCRSGISTPSTASKLSSRRRI